jgi:hypothetical protein
VPVLEQRDGGPRLRELGLDRRRADHGDRQPEPLGRHARADVGRGAGDAEIAPASFGDGLRCAGGNLKRLYAKNAVGGAVTAPEGAEPTISARSAALGDSIPTLATRIYQVYYRDPDPAFCPDPQGSTFNVSNGLRVLWGP